MRVGSDTQNILLLRALAICLKNRKVKKQKKKYWAKQWLLKRQHFSHVNLLIELKTTKCDWFNYLRMDEETYMELLKLVSPFIMKQDTCMREAISCHERLTATLRFLATGRTYEDLKFSVIISPQLLSNMIPEVCRAITKALEKHYLKFPKTQEDWKTISKQFETRWNFPNVLGAVDGKHVQIIPPPNSGSFYYNYKGTHSMVLMAIGNANYEFIMADFGINGRISDGGVIECTRFYNMLINNQVNIPKSEKTDNSIEELPYVFIGDESFALRTDILKPFSRKDLTTERRIFNYRLSRARRIIENIFGILAARFRIFHTSIALKIENTEDVVLSCCVLHNYLRNHCSNTYTVNREDYNEEDLNCFIQLEKGKLRNSSALPKEVRETYLRYFNNESSVDWQLNSTS